jgi:hypothetical protein
VFKGRRCLMTRAREQGDRSHSRIRWFILFLVFALFLGSTETHAAFYATNSLTGVTVSSRVALASTQSRIALVKPIFSATAYTNAFYSFYYKYDSVPPGEYVTTDLNLLNRTVVDGWKWSERLGQWFEGDTARSLHLILGETVALINEIDVDRGVLFHEGVRLYDVLILGFTEYVTEREYLYYKQFVASGGTLIIMDACNFLAEVTYSNGYLSLTKGHGWEFNGTHAWKSDYHRWYEDNKNWIGGNYWQYWTGNHYDSIRVNTTNSLSDFLRNALGENIPTAYRGHEENLLQNQTGTDIIGYWNLINPSECPDYPVAAYMHRYGDGIVIHSGIMASDVILADRFLPVFLAASIRFGLTGDISQWTYPEPLVSSDDSVESTIVMYNKYGEPTSGTISGLVYCDINFNKTKDVLRSCYRCNLKSLTGKLTKQIDTDHQLSYDSILEARTMNDTCWRLDINTFFISNGNHTLTINATWEGVQHLVVVNESVGVLAFEIQNNWWMSILPWAVPLGAAICAAIITVVYMRFNKIRP